MLRIPASDFTQRTGTPLAAIELKDGKPYAILESGERVPFLTSSIPTPDLERYSITVHQTGYKDYSIVAMPRLPGGGNCCSSLSESPETRLIRAINKGDTEAVQGYIQQGGLNLNQEICPDSKYRLLSRLPSYTPLLFAVEKGRTEIASLLIQHGANVHQFSWNAIFEISQTESEENPFRNFECFRQIIFPQLTRDELFSILNTILNHAHNYYFGYSADDLTVDQAKQIFQILVDQVKPFSGKELVKLERNADLSHFFVNNLWKGVLWSFPEAAQFLAREKAAAKAALRSQQQTRKTQVFQETLRFGFQIAIANSRTKIDQKTKAYLKDLLEDVMGQDNLLPPIFYANDDDGLCLRELISHSLGQSIPLCIDKEVKEIEGILLHAVKQGIENFKIEKARKLAATAAPSAVASALHTPENSPPTATFLPPHVPGEDPPTGLMERTDTFMMMEAGRLPLNDMPDTRPKKRSTSTKP